MVISRSVGEAGGVGPISAKLGIDLILTYNQHIKLGIRSIRNCGARSYMLTDQKYDESA